MKDDLQELFKLNIKKSDSQIERQHEDIILEPYKHINETKGKGFRNMVIEIYNYWLDVDEDKIKLFTIIIQNLHTISLLIDDLQDSSGLRRGNPTAHVIYGADLTVIATDYIFFQTYNLLEDFKNPKIFGVILDFFKKSLRGQAMEVYWRDNLQCPTENEYLDMINKKTGSTCECISNTLEVLSTTGLSLRRVSILLGLYFQISDDLNGLTSKIYTKAKGYCDDIREGKFTHPVVHGVNSNPKDKRILNILNMHTDDIDLKNKCLELLKSYGSLAYTENKINWYKNLLLEEITKFKTNPHFHILFDITEGTPQFSFSLLKKPDRYEKNVLVGNWFEERCSYRKNPHDFRSWYSIDYAPKPRSANDPSLVWDQNLRAQGYGPRIIFDHQAPHFLENYSTSYDLAFNHLPKLAPDGPKHRDFRFKFLSYQPQQDYANNYGNVTKMGLVDFYKSKWLIENPIPRVTLTTHYQDTFVAPPKTDTLVLHRAIPYNNSSMMDKGNRTLVNLKLRGVQLSRVPETDLVVLPRQEVCNPITWECPDKYKEVPDRCVQT